MKQCPTINKLAEYQTEALANREQQAIHQHITNCTVCQRELQALESTVQLLATLPVPALPDNLWAGVAQHLPNNPRIAFRQRWWKALAGAGVAAGIAIGLLVMHAPNARLPIAPASASAYVADHALLSSQDTFADRASIGVMLALQRSEP